MKWYDADELWPGKDARNIIIDGSALLHLKPEYAKKYVHTPSSNGRVYEEFCILANFYCLIESPEPWTGEFIDNICIENALFYEITSYCCNAEDVRESHDDHCRDIGLYYDNIRKFVKKSELRSSMDSMKRWAFLGEE